MQWHMGPVHFLPFCFYSSPLCCLLPWMQRFQCDGTCNQFISHLFTCISPLYTTSNHRCEDLNMATHAVSSFHISSLVFLPTSVTFTALYLLLHLNMLAQVSVHFTPFYWCSSLLRHLQPLCLSKYEYLIAYTLHHTHLHFCYIHSTLPLPTSQGANTYGWFSLHLFASVPPSALPSTTAPL